MKIDYFNRLKIMQVDIEKYLENFYYDKDNREKNMKEAKAWIESYLKEHDIDWNVTVRNNHFNFAVVLKTELELTYFVK
ncbi:unnamed protein product [marine sediment metagenome]|uniref:Uncharacterized protein n=1 Tax=marine sediment metagenome TaxID=412755 RepID=X0SG97_9ZZZZ